MGLFQFSNINRKVYTSLFFISFAVILFTFIERPYSHRYFMVIRGASLEVEVMSSPYARQKGLMGRQFLESNHGMLFVFPQEERVTFWMKNTLIPLDIAFMDHTGKITQIEHMVPENWTVKPPEVRSREKVKYALEVNQGWFEKNQIKPGDIVHSSRTILRIQPE
ncbi:MAG: DUF192 domain-containing protein [Deltaproteobacteria bacterium]|nr:DUF192 domain-containing protein [Deltaproteobacteria bacterium]